MITGWRRAEGDDHWPFLIVQLPGLKREAPELDWRKEPHAHVFDDDPSADSRWSSVRLAQARVAAKLNDVHLVPTIDIGDPFNLHPDNKQEVGRRLALVANAAVYRREQIPGFLALDHVTRAGSTVRLRFVETGEGLRSRDNLGVFGFALAGDDHVFHSAKAELAGPDAVSVTSPDVPTPRWLRYAWGDSPYATLENSGHLPLGPLELDVASAGVHPSLVPQDCRPELGRSPAAPRAKAFPATRGGS